mgnify:CR=1 FL=1
MNTLYLNKQEKDFFKRIKPIIFDKTTKGRNCYQTIQVTENNIFITNGKTGVIFKKPEDFLSISLRDQRYSYPINISVNNTFSEFWFSSIGFPPMDCLLKPEIYNITEIDPEKIISLFDYEMKVCQFYETHRFDALAINKYLQHITGEFFDQNCVDGIFNCFPGDTIKILLLNYGEKRQKVLLPYEKRNYPYAVLAALIMPMAKPDCNKIIYYN